jgi:N-acetylglucosamine kinase-like BadF-type ATPase
MTYYLGIDIGGTKSHALIANQEGTAIGFGIKGSGNWEVVGIDGYKAVLRESIQDALDSAGITIDQISGAGFGVSGYDWPSQLPDHKNIIDEIGISAPYKVVNDSILGLLAGSSKGWGLSVVSGTGCNCRGWNKERTKEGRVVGGGLWSWEFGGGMHLVMRAMKHVTYEWSMRGPTTQLSQAFVDNKKAKDLDDLIEGLYLERYHLDSSDVFVIFQMANLGDSHAQEVLTWAGTELASLAIGVIHQLHFEEAAFEIVLIGSLFDGSKIMIDAMRESITKIAPMAELIRLNAPPVIGGVLLGMEQTGKDYLSIRDQLITSSKDIINTYNKVSA